MQSLNAPTHCYWLRKRKAPPPVSKKRAPGANVPRTKEESNDVTPSTHIDDLPDELLGRVIRNLDPKDRVLVEQLSRQWNRVSRRYGWRSQTHLDRMLYWDYVEERASQDLSQSEKKEIINRRFKCLFDRCFGYLRTVGIDAIGQAYFDHTIIVDLTYAAQNLTRLKLREIPLNVEAAAVIGQRFTKLECLEISNCFEGLEPSKLEQALTAILKGCCSLHELDISNNEMVTGETSFAHLPPTLRSLNIGSCRRLHPSAIKNIRCACAFGQLRKLAVSFLPIDGPVLEMGRLFEELSLLEQLVYRFGEVAGTAMQQDINAAMLKVSTMKELKSLTLDYNPFVCDEVLGAIVYGCAKLEEFTLNELGAETGVNYSPAGLQLLALLLRLISLTLGSIHGLSEEVLLLVVAGGRLRRLRLFDCPRVTDTIIQRLLERCGQLRRLDIIYCKGITRTTVKAIGEFVAGIAIEAVKTRSSTAKDSEQRFHLWCYGSSIVAQPGEVKAELLAANPVLKHVRQVDSKHGGEIKPIALDIWW